MGKLKEKRGITLIALVITIVIIIILSMVAISMVMGDNGLIKEAEKSKDMMNNSIKAEEEGANSVMQEIANIMANKDTILQPNMPVISDVALEEIDETTAKITVTAHAKENGLATKDTYKYYLNNELKEASTSNSYEFTGLNPNETYPVKIEVTDAKGNKTEKNIKIQFKTKVTVNGDTSNGAVKLDAENMKEYIGKKVTNYKKMGGTEEVTVQTANFENKKTFEVSTTYRLFYVDFEENKYDDGVGTIYLKADVIKDGEGARNMLSISKVSNETAIDRVKRYNPELYKSGVTPPDENSNNMKTVTWLLDPAEWEGLKTSGNSTEIGNKVKEVVGAPSLEIFMDSYNTKYSLTGDEPVAEDRTADSPRTKLFYKYTSGQTGYQVGSGLSEVWSKYTGKYTVVSDKKIDPMYYNDDIWYGVWCLASPAAEPFYGFKGDIFCVDPYRTSVSSKDVINDGYLTWWKFCPLVSLESDVILELWDGWKIVE